MPDFQYYVRPRVWIGPDALLRLPLIAEELAGPGKARALLVVDPLLYEAKSVDRVRGLLEERGFQVLVHDEIPDRATSKAADDALRIARGSRAPLVVSMGGLKTLMIGRAAAVAAPSRLDIDALLDGAEIRVSPLPLIEIPTSYRHPLMTTDCIALPDGRDRRPRYARVPSASPQAVLVDPALSQSLPPKVAASCVIDSLLGAVEAYVSSKSNFMSDLILEKAAAILAKALDGLIGRPDDPSHRAEAWRGSFLASLGVGMSALGIGSAVAMAINARYPVPKASLAAILLPYSMEAAMKSRLDKIAALAPILGEEDPDRTPQDSAAKSIEWLRTRLGLLKIPSRLKDFDLVLDKLMESARDARELDFMNYLPRAASIDDVFDFVKTSF